MGGREEGGNTERLGRGARQAAELSRGRRAEGRRCRRRRRLARGDTDARSSRGGESQRLLSASSEPERSYCCSWGECAGGGGVGSGCWGDWCAWGAAGAGVGTWSARSSEPVPAVLPGFISPGQFPSPSSNASEGKENKTKHPEDGWQKRREQLCRGTRRGARGRQDGGALGRKGAFVRLVAQGSLEHRSRAGLGVEYIRWFPSRRSRPGGATGGVCEGWGPGEGALGATERR